MNYVSCQKHGWASMQGNCPKCEQEITIHRYNQSNLGYRDVSNTEIINRITKLESMISAILVMLRCGKL